MPPPRRAALAEAEGRDSRARRRVRARTDGRLRVAASSPRSRSTSPATRRRCAQRVEADAARTAELGNELRRLGGEEVELRGAAAAVAEQIAAIDVELARIDAERDEASARLDAAGAEPAEGDDRDELADARRAAGAPPRAARPGRTRSRARSTRPRRSASTSSPTQRADLERSLDELEQLRRDLTETVERRFEETFAAVEQHFAEVAATLFPGGEGRLRLTEPEDEGEEPGIEVELRPVGKRVTRLSLLLGRREGARARSRSCSASSSPGRARSTSSTRSRPRSTTRTSAASPGLLRQYADRAQFIVVTHQKRTMEAADVLYGVTMGGDGVSQLVSRRLPHDEDVAATA